MGEHVRVQAGSNEDGIERRTGEDCGVYKKALSKYGTVLNCSDRSQKANTQDKSGSSNKLECDDDKPEKGGLVFKAGTKEKQHVVAIQPNGQGSLFQLVYVEAHDDKEKKAN